MKASVRIICSETAASGFRLAGLLVDEVSSPAEAALRLSALDGESEVSVVLIEEDLYARLPPEVAAIERRGTLILVPFPGPGVVEVGAEERVVEILRRAIGYRVRL